MDEIGEKIYNRRKELGLTLEEVGEKVGVGKSTVRKWEKGMIKNMGRDKIAALAKALKMNPVELVPAIKSEFVTVESHIEVDTDAMMNAGRLEALHQDPRLGMLFDRARKMSPDDVDFMIQMADRILKERDKDD